MGRTTRHGTVDLGIEYAPLPSQRRFHDLTARFKGFSGPVGSGKSAALCHEALRLALINSGRVGLLGAPTFPMLRDVTLRAFVEILEENDLPYELNKAESYIVLNDTGSKILFRSLEDYERLRGTNLAWFGIDELTYTPEEAWLRLEARLRDPKATRLCGFGVWTPKGRDWVYRRFVGAPVEGYESVIAKPFENKFLLSKAPDFYERLKHSYDEGFFRQEVLGLYVDILRGVVYKSFRRDLNVRDIAHDPALPLLWALDFNVDPMSSVIAQQMKDGSIRVIDEIVLPDSTTERACDEFMLRYGRYSNYLSVYGDAAGQARQTTGWSDFDIIRKYFTARGARIQVNVDRSNPPVRDRVALVNAKLANAAGETEVVISPRCKELIRDFEEVTYKPGSVQVDKETDPKRTHVSDALGYMLWQLCRPKQTVGPRNMPLLSF